MKAETRNLEALVMGHKLNEYQRSLAKRELLQLKNLAKASLLSNKEESKFKITHLPNGSKYGRTPLKD